MTSIMAHWLQASAPNGLASRAKLGSPADSAGSFNVAATTATPGLMMPPLLKGGDDAVQLSTIPRTGPKRGVVPAGEDGREDGTCKLTVVMAHSLVLLSMAH